MPALPWENAGSPLIPPALWRPIAALGYTFTGMYLLHTTLLIGIFFQRYILLSMGRMPAANTRNPVTMVAAFIAQWKAIRRIWADRARQRAEAEEQGTELVQLQGGVVDGSGEDEDEDESVV